MKPWPELGALQPRLRKIVRNDEDLLQDANLRLLQHRGSIDHLPAYAMLTAKRCLIDAMRAGCPYVPFADDLMPAPGPTPAESASKTEQKELLQLAITRLSPAQRHAIENPGGRRTNSNRHKAIKKLKRSIGGEIR